jgi:hypothetical protein
MTTSGVVGEYIVVDPPENSSIGTVEVMQQTPADILARVRIMRLLYGDSDYLREAQSLALGVIQFERQAAG